MRRFSPCSQACSANVGSVIHIKQSVWTRNITAGHIKYAAVGSLWSDAGCYCPRGSDGLYCFRPSFFFSVSTITNRYTQIDEILQEHVPRQPLEPYFIQGRMSKIKVTWVWVFFCVRDAVATRGQ